MIKFPMAWRGQAGLGAAGQGRAWHGYHRGSKLIVAPNDSFQTINTARPSKARPGEVGLGWARPGVARQGRARQG